MANKYSYIAYIEGDTSGIVKAMKDVEERSKDLNRRMKVINEGLKFNPESVELLGSKFDTLSEQLENAKTKFEALKKVEEQAKHSRETGATTKDQYAQYIRELTKAENNYKMLEIAAGTAKTQLDNVKESLKQTAFATEGLGGTLSNLNNIGKEFDDELKEINTSLKNGGGAEILEQKYTVLSNAIENTKDKLNALKSAEQNMNAGIENGTVSENQQRSFQRELDSTANKLARYQSELESVQNALNDMNASAGSAADGIEDISDGISQIPDWAGTVAESIKNIDSMTAGLKSQMLEINSSLQLDPGNTELLSQKYATFSNVIFNTKNRLNELYGVQQQMETAFSNGEIGVEQYNAFRREIINTESALNGLIAAQDSMLDKSGKLRDVTDEMDDLGDSIENAGQQTITFGDLLKANLLSDFIGSRINKLKDSVVDFVKQGVELASNLTEVQNVVDVTFGDGAQQIYDWADAAAESFGMSSLAAQQYNGTMGAMLKSMGLTDNAVREMSMDMVGLAGDMASFYNLPVEQAFEKIRSGISGETEPLKQLGINMSVANLEAYALSQGIETAYSKMTEAEKATLRYNYLMEQTADAQGDFARTSDSFANQQRILELQAQNLAASFGEKLLPSLNNVFQTANDKLPRLENTVENIGAVLGKVTEIALDNHEAIISLITAYASFQGVSKAGTFISSLVGAFKKLTTATKAAEGAQQAHNAAAAANPYVLVAAAVAALTVGLITYANSVDSVHNSIKDVNNEVRELQKNTEESIAGTEAEIAVFRDKAAQYEELREKANRTAGEEERLAQLAEELQQYMPAGTQLINEQTGAYNSLADSVDGVSVAMRRKATIAAYEDEYTELIKQQLEAEKNLEEAQKKLSETSKLGLAGEVFNAKDYNDAAKAVEDIENRLSELDGELNKLYDDSAKDPAVSVGFYSDGSALSTTGKYYEEQGKLAVEAAEKEKAAREQDLKDYVADLDEKQNLRKISEQEYYDDLYKYLTEHEDRESVEWFKQLGRYEDYQQKQTDAAVKAAEDEKSAREKLEKNAEEERINTIKGYWDKVTKMKDRGEIDDEKEYKLKAQIVNAYCDENEDTWDSYYKWLYDYTKNHEDELADARLKAWDESAKALSDKLEKSYSDLKSQKEQVRKELLNIDLSETFVDKNGNDIEILNDLDDEIKKIDKYVNSLKKLEATGISDSLLAKISEMSYEDGSRQRMIDTFLNLSESGRQKYYADWERLYAKEAEAEQKLFGDKEAELNQEAANAVKDIFKSMPEEAYDEGVKTAQSYIQGIIDSMDGANDISTINAVFRSAYSDMTGTSRGSSQTGTGITDGQRYVLANTPITININGKKEVETTLQDFIDMGNRSGGNVFNL